jgi:hypothetical protein
MEKERLGTAVTGARITSLVKAAAVCVCRLKNAISRNSSIS